MGRVDMFAWRLRDWQHRIRERIVRSLPVRTSVKLKASPADLFLTALAGGEEVTKSVALVAAHPDDETIGIGGRLPHFRDLTLIHVTNGAPDRPGARLGGFGDIA